MTARDARFESILNSRVRAVADRAYKRRNRGLLQILKKLTDHMNRTHTDQWKFFLPEDLKSELDLTAAIVGFEMTPDDIIGKFKLSQARSKEDQRRAIEALGSRPDEASSELRKWMSKNL